MMGITSGLEKSAFLHKTYQRLNIAMLLISLESVAQNDAVGLFDDSFGVVAEGHGCRFSDTIIPCQCEKCKFGFCVLEICDDFQQLFAQSDGVALRNENHFIV